MSSQGSPHARFARAIKRRQVFQAEVAARELGRLSLNDALSLVCLYAAAESPKFEPAAVRWLVRLGLEERGVTLSAMQVAADSLAQLRGPGVEAARETLRVVWSAAGATSQPTVAASSTSARSPVADIRSIQRPNSGSTRT